VKNGENPVPAMVGEMYASGSMAFLVNLPERATADPDTVGWMGDYDPESASFVYIAGVLARPDSPVPEGYDFRDIKPCQIAMTSIQGTDDNDTCSGGHNHSAKAMAENGYEYDRSAGGFEIEYFPYQKFEVPLLKGEKNLVMDYWSPCKKS
jgi:AraC family transcriptional regulator